MKKLATLRLAKQESHCPETKPFPLWWKFYVIALFLLFLAACGTPNFLTDPKGSKHPENWYADVAECQTIVDTKHSVGWASFKSAMMGSIGSAGLAYGAVKLGHVNQPTGYAVGAAAIAGGLFAGLLGGAQAAGDNQDFVKKCLEGRGHVILE